VRTLVPDAVVDLVNNVFNKDVGTVYGSRLLVLKNCRR